MKHLNLMKHPAAWGALVATLLIAGFWTWNARSNAAAQNSRAAEAPVALVVLPATPKLQTWKQTVSANGSLAAWQEAVVAAEVNGVRVAQLLVDIGAKVKRGQTLAVLDDATLRTQVVQLQASLAQARASLAQAQADAQRTRALKDSGALSQQQIIQSLTSETSAEASVKSAEAALESARINVRRTQVVAPDDGLITARSATLGAVVQSGTEMFRLVRQDRIEWRAEVAAGQLDRIFPEAAVRVQLAGGNSVTGRVRMIAPSLDSGTRNALVYVRLPNAPGVRSGSYASGQIELGETSALTLPQSAVSLRDGRSQVFVLGERSGANKDTAVVRLLTVHTGRRQDELVEILDGLPADATVANSGVAFLNDGDRVRIVEESTTTADTRVK